MKKIVTIIVVTFLTIISFNSCENKYDKISPEDYVLSPDWLTLLQWFKKDVKGIDFQSDPILSKITTINGTIFSGCHFLKNIILPKGITEIRYKTFANSGLENIVLTDNITTIGTSAFEGCTSLTTITIPNSVTEIAASAFEDCTSLATITIPNSVTAIGASAFRGCESLKSISFPENITKISCNTFRYCSSLVSFSVPHNVTEIERGAFAKCYNLTSIEIPEGVKLLGINGDCKFSYDGYDDYDYSGVFEECNSLVSIELPSTITKIGVETFSNCEKLTFITFKSLAPPLLVIPSRNENYKEEILNRNKIPFLKNSPVQAIYVPTESLYEYQNNLYYYIDRYGYKYGKTDDYTFLIKPINANKGDKAVKENYISLSTGATPWEKYYGENIPSPDNNYSKIEVKTNWLLDVVLIVKKDNKVVAHTYIKKIDSHSLYLPNGTYQVFFYCGNNWNPEKEMKDGLMKGGFMRDEAFKKDDTPQILSNNRLLYELVAQPNGNFNTKLSSEKEAL